MTQKRPTVVKYPENYKRKKKAAIMGTASRTINEVPWEDASIEKFCLAWRGENEVGRADRFFEMHPQNVTEDRNIKGHKNYPALLRERNERAPLIVSHETPLLPHATVFPREEVNEFLRLGFGEEFKGYFSDDYFGSSIAYMFSLAMYEGYEEIHVYGVDLLDEEEYVYQRPNLHYLIALARGMGYKVYIPEKSSLCKLPFIYGYEDKPWDKDQIISESGLRNRLKILEEKRQEAISALHTIDGGLQIIKEQINQHEKLRQGTVMPKYGFEQEKW